MGKRCNQALALFLALVPLTQTSSAHASGKRPDPPPPQLEIKLESLGYRPPEQPDFSNREIARDPSLLLRENDTRITFINGDALAVYFSRVVDVGKIPPQFPQLLEAFFIDPHIGTLLSRKTWPTRWRRWFNDSYDTEGRILPLQNGFLVHAGDALRLYSYDFQLKRELALEAKPLWSVRVAPGGRTIQALRIHDSDGQAEWLDFETLDTLRRSHEFPSIDSISESGMVVSMLAHCIDLQIAGGFAQDFCCNNECSQRRPVFLDDTDILMSGRGFEVMSPKGEILWKRETDSKLRNESFGVEMQSLQGNRFAFVLYGSSRNSTFDGVKLRKGYSTILVYDAAKRTRVFETSTKIAKGQFGFALSPTGDSLALLAGESLYIYAIPR